MGLFDDIAMGTGLKEKDQDYYDRTAATIERTQGSGAADRYRERTADARAAAPGGSTSTGNTVTYTDERTGETGTTIRPKLRPTYVVQNEGGTYSPATRASDRTGIFNTYESDGSGGPAPVSMAQPTFMESMGGGTLGSILGYLGGTRSTDSLVNVIDGKPIYEDSKGRTYSINALGLPYNTAGKDTLDEDPEQVARREAMMGGMGSDDDGSSVIDELLDSDSGTTDPCPEGYVYDSEQMMCVIDPSTGFTPDLPTMELPDPSVPLSDYTQVANNFIPTPLQPIAPNPIQQQLSRLSRSLSGPRQQQRASGLAGANTGIMQVKP